MFGIITKMFIIVLSNRLNASNRTKCVLLNNQKCEIQPTLIDLHPNEYTQDFHYYPFEVKLDRRTGSFNTLNDLSNNKACVLNKTKDINLSVFNMITGINESKALTKDISYECKRKFDEQNVSPINGEITISVDIISKNSGMGERLCLESL